MWQAVILHGYHRSPCTIIDVSRQGAKLSLAEELPLKGYVVLLCENFGSLEGTVIWGRDRIVGIKFSDPAAAAALRELFAQDVAEVPSAPKIAQFGRRRA